MKILPAEKFVSPPGTDIPAAAGTSPVRNTSERNMLYLAQSGTQKTHPTKPSQPNVMRHI